MPICVNFQDTFSPLVSYIPSPLKSHWYDTILASGGAERELIPLNFTTLLTSTILSFPASAIGGA